MASHLGISTIQEITTKNTASRTNSNIFSQSASVNLKWNTNNDGNIDEKKKGKKKK